MPYRVGSNVRFNVVTTPPKEVQPQPVVEPAVVDPRLLANIRTDSTYETVKPKTRFDTIKRTGTDDDSLGGGAALKQKGVYDVVNEGVVGRDTDPNRLALRDAIWDRLETPSYLREGAASPKPVDAKKLASALGDNVSARQSASLTKKAQATPQAGHNLVEFFSNTKTLSKDVKTSLLSTLTSDPGGTAGSVVANITGSKAFGAMSAADKGHVATVMSRLDEKGLKTLGALFENVPEALADKDSAGGTLLSNLATLASQPLNASLTGHTTTEELLSSVLADVMNPNRIEQGTANTCTVASMQFELVADEPAEYARLMAGITGPKGTVKMKAGGDLRLGPGDADEGARNGRSVSQTVFQSVAMEYANGRFSNYDPVLGVSINEKTGEERLGLRGENQQALLEKLFGVNYSINRLYSENESTNAFAKLVGWDARGNRNRPIVVDIDQGKYNHAVTLESVSKEKVVFRDPYGVLRSMSADAFPKVAVAIHMPMDVKVNGVG